MTFFKIAGVTLFVIAVLNLLQVAVEMGIRGSIYSCFDVSKSDPIDVQKKCGKIR